MSGKYVQNKQGKCPLPHQQAVTYRFDVTMQEANRVDALYGLQDLAPQAQGGADAEGSPGHTPPQVSQVTSLREPTDKTSYQTHGTSVRLHQHATKD